MSPAFPSQITKPDLRAKIIFVGRSGVGKTSIILRHDGQGFYSKVSPTLGASFISSFLVLDGKSVELQIWDTAGQERYASMLPMYLRNAVAAVIVYDITDRESFQEIKKWVNEVKRGSTVPVSLFVVGNKLDLENARAVQCHEGAQYAEQIGAAFHETSAMNGEGADHADLNFYI
ncbi:Ras family protein [Loa loa]|uniref:Ras family protein n=1 Tax=Loa loa TaxID=7209 RepID=A0A1S0UBD6_LOALO|nr:Ras family protein [Loa loa]EFO27861.2 Ras family protein [Loa loa]